MRRSVHQSALWSAMLLLTTATGCQSTGGIPEPDRRAEKAGGNGTRPFGGRTRLH